MKKEKILVLNGENTIGYQTIRAISKNKKYEIHCGGSSIFSRSFFSKYVKKRLYYKNLSKKNTLNKILNYLKKNKIDLIFPVFTDSILFVNKNKNKIKKYSKIIDLPNNKLIKIINDKNKFNKKLKKYGFNIPKYFKILNLKYLKKISKKIKFPVLLKPRISCAGIGIKKIKSKKELINEYKNLIKNKNKNKLYNFKEPILQEYITGKEFAIQYIIKNKKAISIIVSKRIEVYPRFGAPVESKTISKKPYIKIIKKGEKLFSNLNYNGLICLTFIRDKKKDYFIESNPRLWSDMLLYSNCGINMPIELIDISLNKKITQKKYKKHKFINITGYILNNITKFKFFFPNTSYDFTIKDPFPFIIFILTRPIEIIKKNKRWFL